MKKLSSVILVICSLLSGNAFSDNIEEFQIEGISLGDGALNYFTEDQIKKNSRNYYKSKTYVPVQNDNMSFFKTYDAVDFVYKRKDTDYTIVSLSGIISYKNKNIKDCYKEMDEIVLEMDQLFTNITKKYPKETFKHPSKQNKSGKSTFTEVRYLFKNGDMSLITCYDYSVEHGSMDHLNISLDKKKFAKWLQTKAY